MILQSEFQKENVFFAMIVDDLDAQLFFLDSSQLFQEQFSELNAM